MSERGVRSPVLAQRSCALMSASNDNPATTTPIGTDKIASISESIPIKKRSELPCSSLGATNSQKRARTNDDRTRSEHLSCPTIRVVAILIHLIVSFSPSSPNACRTDRTGDDKFRRGEFKYRSKR